MNLCALCRRRETSAYPLHAHMCSASRRGQRESCRRAHAPCVASPSRLAFGAERRGLCPSCSAHSFEHRPMNRSRGAKSLRCPLAFASQRSSLAQGARAPPAPRALPPLSRKSPSALCRRRLLAASRRAQRVSRRLPHAPCDASPTRLACAAALAKRLLSSAQRLQRRAVACCSADSQRRPTQRQLRRRQHAADSQHVRVPMCVGLAANETALAETSPRTTLMVRSTARG